jgi:AcrR family transcriptional regulator
MDTALEVFAEYGYASASISMIAQKAGVSKGLMYNYFESKEALLISIVEEGIEEMVELVDPNKDGILIKEEFEFLIDGMFNLMRDKNNFYKLYFSLMMQPSVSSIFMNKLNQVIEPFIKLFIDYYTKKGSKNPVLEAVLVGAMFDGIGFNYVFNPGVYPLDEVIQLVKERFV